MRWHEIAREGQPVTAATTRTVDLLDASARLSAIRVLIERHGADPDLIDIADRLREQHVRLLAVIGGKP
jgi:hypothetical protein